MAPLLQIISCSIVEKDTNNETLWVWNYPSINEKDKALITRKYHFQLEIFDNNSQSFTFACYNQKWFYIYNSDMINSDNLNKVKQFAIILVTQDYYPQKYECLCKIFSRAYSKSGNPIEVLKLYLSCFSKGSCIANDTDSFSNTDFDVYFFGAATNIKGLIKMFELETILIYTALLLKKRIAVYHHNLEHLQKWLKSFPALMKHRKITSSLFSWVDLIQEDIGEIKKHSFYVAGFKDSLISTRYELYDLLVNLPAREIIIPIHAKESLTMTKTHKEIAMYMVQLSENQSLTELQVISEIAEKTQDLLSQLTILASVETAEHEKKVPIQAIKEKNLSPAVENFLINLAVAEDMLLM